MARPVKGDTRVEITKVRKSDKLTYVYERTVKYNPKLRRNDIISSKLIGKITPESKGEIIPTKFRAKPQKKTTEPKDISRYHMGMMSLLEWIGDVTGIDSDLKKVMPEAKYGPLAERISSIARFWVATGGDTLPDMYAWQVKHGIAPENMISESVYHDVFELLGTNENIIQNYFRLRASRMDSKDSVAYDSTTISTYSDSLTQARFGYNKEHDGLPTIKVLTLYSLNTEQPFAYWTQPGNIPDSICVENALKQLDFLDIDKPMVVTDNGFCTQENIVSYVQNHDRFASRITKNDGKWVSDAYEKYLHELNDINNVIDFDDDIAGVCTTVRPKLSYTAKYTTSHHKKGEHVTLSPRLYLGIFRSRSRQFEADRLFTKELYDLKKLIEEGKEDQLSETALNKANKFLNWSSSNRTGKIKVTFNKEAVDEAKKYMGIFSMCSNKINTPSELLSLGRKREHIEDMFELLKQKTDGNKPRVHDTDRLRGRQFVQFIALCYYDYLYKRLKDLKSELGVPNGDARHDLKQNLKDETTLLKWIKNSSLNEILQWFDAIDLIRLTGKKHQNLNLITETTKRDRMFLEKIGYYGEMNHRTKA